MRGSLGLSLVIAGMGLVHGSNAFGATPVATYTFNNSFAALEPGDPAMVAVDPLGTSGFQSAMVFGNTRTVYHFDGAASPPASQGGLSLDTTSLIPGTNYSAEMAVELDESSGWRRLIDVQNRQSDNGFYVDPSSDLDIFPVSGSTGAFSPGVFHHVVLTDSGGTANGYLDGTLQFTASTTVMDVNNPGNLINFFLDNVVAGGQGEWSSGDVGLVRLYNGALTDQEVATLANDPFANTPEPTSLALSLIGGSTLLLSRRRAR